MASDYEQERRENAERHFKLESLKLESEIITGQHRQTTMRIIAVCVLLAIIGGCLTALRGCELSNKAVGTNGK